MKHISATLLSLCLLSSTTALAKVESSAIYSPNCDEKVLKEIAGDALKSISTRQQWGDGAEGYTVTLDTSKMTFADMAKEMMKKKCFETS